MIVEITRGRLFLEVIFLQKQVVLKNIQTKIEAKHKHKQKLLVITNRCLEYIANRNYVFKI